jgi:hypothetical protein
LKRRKARGNVFERGCGVSAWRSTVGSVDDEVTRKFLTDDGRLHTVPRKRSKRLVVLDLLAQEFELGRTYPEKDVTEILGRFHPDYAALRRYLVDDQFLTREDNVYWRTGGTVDV